MPKVITDQQTRDICRMINTWDTQHKLDWNTICLGAQEILGWTTPPTRQALNKKTTIKLAYQAKKTPSEGKSRESRTCPDQRQSRMVLSE